MLRTRGCLEKTRGEAGSNAGEKRKESIGERTRFQQCGRHKRKGTHTKCMENARANVPGDAGGLTLGLRGITHQQRIGWFIHGEQKETQKRKI